MKRGYQYSERPGVRYGWAIIGRRGYMFGDVRSSRRELINETVKAWGGRLTWEQLRRRYKLRTVWVKLEVVDKNDIPK